MPPCFCPTCKGAPVSADVRRSHQRSELRSKGQLPVKLARIIPRSAKPSVGPVPRTLSEPEPIPPFPDLDFPEWTSSEAVEQEMLDRGTLTREDIEMKTYGSSLPSLGQNIHDPRVLLAYVDHH